MVLWFERLGTENKMDSSINHDNSVTAGRKKEGGSYANAIRDKKKSRTLKKVNSVVVAWRKNTILKARTICVHWQETALYLGGRQQLIKADELQRGETHETRLGPEWGPWGTKDIRAKKVVRQENCLLSDKSCQCQVPCVIRHRGGIRIL